MLSVQGTNITSPIRKRNQTDLSRIGAGKKPLTLYTNINMGHEILDGAVVEVNAKYKSSSGWTMESHESKKKKHNWSILKKFEWNGLIYVRNNMQNLVYKSMLATCLCGWAIGFHYFI